MNLAIRLFAAVTLFITMLGLGLGLPSDSLQLWLRQSSMALRVALGSCLLVPLLGLLLLRSPWSEAVSRPDRVAIALMALCPSAPLAIRRARKAGGDHQLAALLQVAAALTAIVSVPLLAVLFRRSFMAVGWQIDPLEVALQVGQAQLLPLLLGLVLRHRWPQLAERLQGPLERIANALLLLLIALVLIKAGPLLLQLFPAVLPALGMMAALAGGALLIGRGLAGSHDSHAITISLVTAMRNPGLALLILSHHDQTIPGVRLAVLLHVLVTSVVSLPLLRRAGAVAATADS